MQPDHLRPRSKAKPRLFARRATFGRHGDLQGRRAAKPLGAYTNGRGRAGCGSKPPPLSPELSWTPRTSVGSSQPCVVQFGAS